MEGLCSGSVIISLKASGLKEQTRQILICLFPHPAGENRLGLSHQRLFGNPSSRGIRSPLWSPMVTKHASGAQIIHTGNSHTLKLEIF